MIRARIHPLRAVKFETTFIEANMNRILAIEDALIPLREIIEGLNPGDELVVTREGIPIARLTRQESQTRPRRPGSAKHIPHWMAPDFDEPLDDFKEYME